MDRSSQFKELVHFDQSSGNINLESLKEFILVSFPDEFPELRFILWQLALGVLPPQRENWDSKWIEIDDEYQNLLSATFSTPDNFLQTGIDSKGINEKQGLMKEIKGDVFRLPHCLPAISEFINNEAEYNIHVRRLERILYTFSENSQLLTYTQGLHELLGPLYYVSLLGSRVFHFSDDRCESITYSLFFSLVITSKYYQLFSLYSDLSKASERFSLVERGVEKMDPKYSNYLFHTLKLQPMYFTMPLVSVLFTQALPLPSLLHLWDHVLFFGDHVVDFAMIICSAYVLFRKKEIFKMTTECALSELQKPIQVSMISILRIAHNIWDILRNDVSL